MDSANTTGNGMNATKNKLMRKFISNENKTTATKWSHKFAHYFSSIRVKESSSIKRCSKCSFLVRRFSTV